MPFGLPKASIVRAMVFSPFLIRVLTPATVSPQETGDFPPKEAVIEALSSGYPVLSGDDPAGDAAEQGGVRKRAMMNAAVGNEYRDFMAGYYTRMKLN